MPPSTNHNARPRSRTRPTTGPSPSSSTRRRGPSTSRPLLTSSPLVTRRGLSTARSGAPTTPSLRRDPDPRTGSSFSSRSRAPYAPFWLPPFHGNNTKYVISSRSYPWLKKGNFPSFLPPSGGPPVTPGMTGPPFFPPFGSWSGSGAPCAASIAVNMGSPASLPPAPAPSPYWWSPWSFPPVRGAPWINPGASGPPHPSAWMHPLAPPFGPPLMGPGPPPTPLRSFSEAPRNAPLPPPPSDQCSDFRWGSPGISEWNPATWSPVPTWGRTSWPGAPVSATTEERRPLLDLDPETPSGPSPPISPFSLPPPLLHHPDPAAEKENVPPLRTPTPYPAPPPTTSGPPRPPSRSLVNGPLLPEAPWTMSPLETAAPLSSLEEESAAEDPTPSQLAFLRDLLCDTPEPEFPAIRPALRRPLSPDLPGRGTPVPTPPPPEPTTDVVAQLMSALEEQSQYVISPFGNQKN